MRPATGVLFGILSCAAVPGLAQDRDIQRALIQRQQQLPHQMAIKELILVAVIHLVQAKAIRLLPQRPAKNRKFTSEAPQIQLFSGNILIRYYTYHRML